MKRLPQKKNLAKKSTPVKKTAVTVGSTVFKKHSEKSVKGVTSVVGTKGEMKDSKTKVAFVKSDAATGKFVTNEGSYVRDSSSGISTGHNQSVIPLGNGWVVKGEKARTFTVITDSKRDAITIARGIASTNGSKVVIHGKDGSVTKREAFSNASTKQSVPKSPGKK